MVTRIADENLPYGGTWTFDVAPDSGGSALTITEDGEIKSALFRVMARFVFGYHATQEAILRGIAAHLGENAEPERVR